MAVLYRLLNIPSLACILFSTFTYCLTLENFNSSKSIPKPNLEQEDIAKVNSLVGYFENLGNNGEYKSSIESSRDKQPKPVASGTNYSDTVRDEEQRATSKSNPHQSGQDIKVTDYDEFTRLSITINEKQQELESLKQQEIDARNSLKELHHVLESERTQNRNFAKQLEELSLKNEKARETQKFLDEVKEILEIERTENRNTLKHLREMSLKEKSDFEGSLKDLQKGLDKERVENKNLIEKLREMSIKDTETQKTLKELQEVLQNEQSENSNLKKQLEVLSVTNEKAKETEMSLKEMQDLLEKERVENRNTLKQLREISLREDSETGESFKELQKALDNERSANRDLLKQFEDASARRQETEIEKEQLKENLIQTKEKLDALHMEMRDAKRTHELVLKSVSSQYEQRLTSMDKDYNEMNKELENELKQKEQELSYLKNELSINKVKHDEYLDEIRTSCMYETKSSAMEKQMHNCEDQLTELERSLNSKESKISELKKLTIDKNNTITRLEAELEKLKGTKKKAEEESSRRSSWSPGQFQHADFYSV